MAQHDYSIANQTAASLRTDLNNVLAAIVSNNSGATAPADTYANMFWYDTTANILKMRNEADDAWISLGYLDQTADAFRILDDTQVVNTSGTQTGLLGDQSTATWEAGVGTTESLVSPAKVASAVDALVDTTKVLAETAGASLGGVGTYAFISTRNTTRNPGTLVSGADLDWGGVQANGFNNNLSIIVRNTSPSLSGTWMCVGQATASAQAATLFLRVS